MDNSQTIRTKTPERLSDDYTSDRGSNISSDMSNILGSNETVNSVMGGGGDIGNNNQPSRRPQMNIQQHSTIEQRILSPQTLKLTIIKDSNGYGMKVSGDNPVFVESVKAGGAAEKAGLIGGDMILKVNGESVRCSRHTDVVQLIKSQVIVELTVHRKMQRPTSIGTGQLTPIPPGDRITGPQPVDNEKRRQMEFSKIKTLKLMLEEEKKNLECLKLGSGANNKLDRAKAEATINKLQEQLRQAGGEDISSNILSFPSPGLTPTTPVITPTSQHHSSPAFLSRFPRSLSSLNLGTRKKSEKDIAAALNNIITANPNMDYSHSKDDIPPPLPERNLPRKHKHHPTGDDGSTNQISSDWRGNTPVSDLDNSTGTGNHQNHKKNNLSLNIPDVSNMNRGNNKKGGVKTKMKALSDPKMTTEVFLEMEKKHVGGDIVPYSPPPPPLPPRQYLLMDEHKNLHLSNKMVKSVNNISSEGSIRNNIGSGSGGMGGSGNSGNSGHSNHSGSDSTGNNERALPNSLATTMNYPLISVCTPVRDNMHAGFSNQRRASVVQQLHQNPHHTSNISMRHNANNANALGQTPQQHNSKQLNKHRRVVSSPDHVQSRQDSYIDRHNKNPSGSWNWSERETDLVPPGTPPPPYMSSRMTQSQAMLYPDEGDNFLEHENTPVGSPTLPHFPNQICAAQSNIAQRGIISMEDEEISDQECALDEHGPFNYLQRLLEQENLVHLAVFLNYVLLNSDPAPLLFYLITSLYKEGSVKDMRKWAYEIHSTFLVPCAPLLWSNVDESLAREVDDNLQNEYDKVEILRQLFWKSRKKAKERICDQLREFQMKRTAGLGTMYGPNDQLLAEAKGDKAREQKIFEGTLLPKLEQLVEDIEREAPVEHPRKIALCAALSTVMHRIFVIRCNHGGISDRVTYFVSREKSFKTRLIGKHRKITVRGHSLALREYYEVTHCNHCQNILWGVSPQGYHCIDCKLNIHRYCVKTLEENCPGPVPSKRKEQTADNKISKMIHKIRTPHHNVPNERLRCSEVDSTTDEFLQNERKNTGSNISALPPGSDTFSTEFVNTEMDIPPLDTVEESKKDRSKSKSAPVSVSRSESCKERLSQRRRKDRRKTSDPSLSKTNDELLGNYVATSTSSLSSISLDSRSTSLEKVAPVEVQTGNSHILSSNDQNLGPKDWIDSEEENDLTEVAWTSNISPEILATLSDAERERQQVINELYETEKNHVRTLRLLECVFMRTLQGALPYDYLQLLFPSSLISLKEIHSSFEQSLKQRRNDHGHIVQSIGDLLLNMFESQLCNELREHAAKFCERQQIALEALKERRRKDENLQRLLNKAESHKACRRLQLKDLLPTVLQRITKYPLLFEKLLKITLNVRPDDSTEACAIQQALDSSKSILVYVNQAVKSAEDAHKLANIQRKLDKSGYERDASIEIRNLDLTQHKLIHDGPLTMRKSPGTQLHGLLFENMMVLLQKQDDKYMLRSFPSHGPTSADSKPICPITNFDQQTLVRQSAVDKKSFFLIITKPSQMVELTAPSNNECKTWVNHISNAAEQHTPRNKNNNEIVEDPASTTLPHSNTRESIDSTITVDQTQPAGSNNNSANESQWTQDSEPDTYSINNNNNNNNNNNIVLNDRGNLTATDSLDTQNDNINDSNRDNISDKDTIELKDNSEKCVADENATDADVEATHKESVFSNNSNNTRTLMQHSPLVQPSDICINSNAVLTAEPVVTPSEKLRRLDDAIRERIIEKQSIVCKMFRVPNEDFSTIADIVGQPEAPKDTSNILLAAFAQVQLLTEVLNKYTKVNMEQEISAVSTSVCDQCSKHRNQESIFPSKSKGQFEASDGDKISLSGPLDLTETKSVPSREITLQEDDGYCQIDELRLPSIVPNSLKASTPDQRTTTKPPADFVSTKRSESFTQRSRMSGNDRKDDKITSRSLSPDITKTTDVILATKVDTPQIPDARRRNTTTEYPLRNSKYCGQNRLAHVNSLEPSIPCHTISGIVTTLNAQISLLLGKMDERDKEREVLKRENQYLRELLNSFHERQRVSEEKEAPKSNSFENNSMDSESNSNNLNVSTDLSEQEND